jgi:hypothetical protein
VKGAGVAITTTDGGPWQAHGVVRLDRSDLPSSHAPASKPEASKPEASKPEASSRRGAVAPAPWSRRRIGIVACALLLVGLALVILVVRSQRREEPPVDARPGVHTPATSAPQGATDPVTTSEPVPVSTTSPMLSSTVISGPPNLQTDPSAEGKHESDAPAADPPAGSRPVRGGSTATGKPTSAPSEPAGAPKGPGDGPPNPPPVPQPSELPEVPAPPPGRADPAPVSTAAPSTRKSPRILGSEE